MATLRIAFTLAHEVGHHIIARQGYIYNRWEKYEPWKSGRVDWREEKMCDTYASEVVNSMCTSWYYKCGKMLTRTLSYLIFQLAIREHWKGNYDKAAYWGFQAFMIDRDNLDAGQSYSYDLEQVISKPQPQDYRSRNTPSSSRPR